jgi:superfamily I DNA/RNA helicase
MKNPYEYQQNMQDRITEAMRTGEDMQAARIADLEAQNARLLELVRDIEESAPRENLPQLTYGEHAFWIASEKCRALLAELDAKGEVE